VMKQLARLSEMLERPFWFGVVAGSVAVLSIGWLLAELSMVPLSLNALTVALSETTTNKFTSLIAVLLIASAILIRLMLGTLWEVRLRQIAFAVIGLSGLGGCVFNLLMFADINRSEPYQLRSNPASTLAELAASMPDKYPSSDILVWLRQHAAGSELTASAEDLQSAGLAFRRLVGISHLTIHVVGKAAALSEVKIMERDFKRFQVEGATKQIWIDIEKVRSGAILCAVPTADALLFISSTDVPGCEATQ
jgi:hypothetical protein